MERFSYSQYEAFVRKVASEHTPWPHGTDLDLKTLIGLCASCACGKLNFSGYLMRQVAILTDR
jgi:hypothetical protein